MCIQYKCHLQEIEVNNQFLNINYIYGLVQDCSNSIANAMELLQSCTKPSVYVYYN